MVNKIINRGKKIFTSPQSSVLSAATIIMVMIVASRVLGLVRQRTLAHFFEPSELSLFFAAFRLPDLVFEVLVFGTFSSAFIPVFARSIKIGKGKAWETASTIVNIGLVIFAVVSILLIIGARGLYGMIAPGFDTSEIERIARLARILFAAQGFFVISYVLTGVLESLKRFLIPALAPLFYNVGIIVGTIFLYPKFGLIAPALGVVLGAFAHFMIQLPLALRLGFRFRARINITPEVKKVGKLALPRIIEVSFLQISKMAELFFSSLISTAAYTYYTFGNSLQLLPVGLFGTSIAKAALPTLAAYADDNKKFKKTLFSALYDMAFLVIPAATILIVLRVPVVRLVYGTDIFSWEATIQTGYVLTAFSIGVFFQAASALLARSFYALHDTRTPVTVAVLSILLIITFDYLFINVLGFGVWGLAAAFSIGSFFQATSLFYAINKRVNGEHFFKVVSPLIKSAFAAASSGFVMYLLLKVFDRSVWVKRLSFLGKIEATRDLPFEKFVLDTRYTVNLIILMTMTTLVGAIIYIGVSIILRSEQVWVFFNLLKRVFIRRKVAPIPAKEPEPVTPSTTDTAG
jgi:putative peptidoglycan lipid II flippase